MYGLKYFKPLASKSKRIFAPNGAVYAATRDWISKNETFYSKSVFTFDMPTKRSIDIDYDYQFFIDIQKSEAQLGPYKFFNLQISDEAIYSNSLGTKAISFLVFERYTGNITYTTTNLNKTEIIRTDSYKCSKAEKLF